jgi:hypothetical protein
MVSMNWLQQEASKADPSKDIAIIENPETRNHLDEMLTNIFIPKIWDILDATGYCVEPEKPAISTELSYALTRKVRFLLFDYLQYPFLIGDFSVKEEGWMFMRTFSLGLSKSTKPEILLSLIQDERFVGMPPTIHVEEPCIHPDWDSYYIVTFEAGSGSSLGSKPLEDYAISIVQNVVAVSQEMVNMAMNDKLSTKADVKKFLKVASSAFGAS